jgi:hypothetical protein
MQENPGFGTSFAGFTDYSSCYPIPSTIWIVIGAGIVVFASAYPLLQTTSMIPCRSNLGLNSMYIFVMSFGQFVLVEMKIRLEISGRFSRKVGLSAIFGKDLLSANPW